MRNPRTSNGESHDKLMRSKRHVAITGAFERDKLITSSAIWPSETLDGIKTCHDSP